MKKKILLLIVVTFSFILIGCGKSNELVGSWEGITNDGLKTTFTFEKDGIVKYSNEYGFDSTGTYEIKDDEVTISLESWDKDKVYKFKVTDNELSLTATDQYSPSYDKMIKK